MLCDYSLNWSFINFSSSSNSISSRYILLNNIWHSILKLTFILMGTFEISVWYEASFTQINR